MNNELRTEMRNLMEAQGLSITKVARGVGLSTATISQWLNHSYKGNVEKVEESIRRYLDLQKERASRGEAKRVAGFVQTSVATKVFEVANICHVDGEIGVVIGDAGFGKTTASAKYAAEKAGVIFIEVSETFTANDLVMELHKKVGLCGAGSLHNLFSEAVAKLNGSGRLLIIDEAEHLKYKSLEIIRRLHDFTGIGVLLVGMPRLLGNLRGLKGEFAQLYSRVGIKAVLTPLRQKDTEEIVQAVLPGSNGIWKVFHEKTAGNARLLDKLVKRSIRVAEVNKTSVTEEVIEAALQSLLI